MASGTIQVPPDSTGKVIDTNAVIVNSTTVQRQNVSIADPTVAGGVSQVLGSAPTGTEQGLVTRNIPSGTQPVSGTVTANAGTGTMAVSAVALPLPSGAAQDGTDGTGISQPVGGIGIRGWLSGIYEKLSNVLAVSQSGTWTVQPGNTPNTTAWKVDGSAVTQPVSGTVTANVGTVPVTGTFWQTTQPVSAASLPLPSGASQDGTDGTGITPPSGGVGIRGWLSGIYSKLSSALSVTQSGTWTVQPGNTANTTAWKVDGSSVTQPVSGTFWQTTQPVSGTVSTAPLTGTYADHSGTITLGGTAQTLVPTNASRKYLLVQNQHATEPLWINFTTAATTAQPSLQIPPGGGTYESPTGFVSTELVSVIAATTNHPFSCKEG